MEQSLQCSGTFCLVETSFSSDPEVVFEASLSSHAWLGKLHSRSVEQMLEQGLVGRALATLMFSPSDLENVSELQRHFLFYIR